jgi:hypothetical protein
MNIKDSSKLLFDLLEKEYQEKIKEVKNNAEKTRTHILKKYEDLANLHSKQKTTTMLKESKLKLEQNLQIVKAENESKLSKEREIIYEEIMRFVKQKVLELNTKDKQKIVKTLYEDIKKQITSDYKINVWLGSDLKEQKSLNELKITAESNTEYIEDSVDIRLENSKEQIYKIINQKVN